MSASNQYPSGRRLPKSVVPSGQLYRLASLIPKKYPLSRFYYVTDKKLQQQYLVDVLHDLMQNKDLFNAATNFKETPVVKNSIAKTFVNVLKNIYHDFQDMPDIYSGSSCELIIRNSMYGLRVTYSKPVYDYTFSIDLLEKNIKSMYDSRAIPLLHQVLYKMCSQDGIFGNYCQYLSEGHMFRDIISNADKRTNEQGKEYFQLYDGNEDQEILASELNTLYPDGKAWKKHFEVFTSSHSRIVPHHFTEYPYLNNLRICQEKIEEILKSHPDSYARMSNEHYMLEDALLFVYHYDSAEAKMMRALQFSNQENGAMNPELPCTNIYLGKQTSVYEHPMLDAIDKITTTLSNIQKWKKPRKKSKYLKDIL